MTRHGSARHDLVSSSRPLGSFTTPALALADRPWTRWLVGLSMGLALTLGFSPSWAWGFPAGSAQAEAEVEKIADEHAPTSTAQGNTHADAGHAATDHAGAGHAAPHGADGHATDGHAADGHAADGHGAAGHGGHGDGGHGATPNPLVIDPDLLLFTLLLFLLLMTVLSKFAWKPIIHAVEHREHTIEQQLAAAKAAQEQAARQLTEHQSQVAGAADQVKQMLDQARREAEEHKQHVLAEAQAAASQEKQRALAEISAAKEAALRGVSSRNVESAAGLASKVLRRPVASSDHADLAEFK